MKPKIEYFDSNHLYATKYIRNSKAIAVLWEIFTICYAIVALVAFMTPEWVGDMDSESAGRLGLWQICQRDDTSDNCQRQLTDILSLSSVPFKVATLFVGLSVVTAILTILLSLLLFVVESTTVFYICGWMQTLSALSMIAGCIAFPFGWNSNDFRKICGPESNIFELGLCRVRWAYPLAIIGCIDSLILSALAFILATRNVKIQMNPTYQHSLYKNDVSNVYLTDTVSIAGSRKSLNLQPVLLVGPPGEDCNSQFSINTSNRFNR